jgi:hypothetical protein
MQSKVSDAFTTNALIGIEHPDHDPREPSGDYPFGTRHLI